MGSEHGGNKVDSAHRTLIDFAYRQASRTTAEPTVEQVCSELWRLGVAMSYNELACALEELRLTVTSRSDNTNATTRKMPAAR